MLNKEQSALWDALGIGVQWVHREALEELKKAEDAVRLSRPQVSVPTQTPTPFAKTLAQASNTPHPPISSTVSATPTAATASTVPVQPPVQTVTFKPAGNTAHRHTGRSTDRKVSEAMYDKEHLNKIRTMTWEELNQAVHACALCEISASRLNAVFGEGQPTKDLVLIGEAPGSEEDKRGMPFVGPAGKLLSLILESVGLKRGEDLAVLNTLKCRPPGNATPQEMEILACKAYLERQIELLDPKLIVLMGKPAARCIFGTDDTLNSRRLKVYAMPIGGKERKIVVTYHPSYLLRSPADKRKAWVDWCLVLDTYQQLKNTSKNAV